MFRGKRDGDDRKYLQWVFVGMRWSPEYSFPVRISSPAKVSYMAKKGFGRFWFLLEAHGLGKAGLAFYKES